jgi:hypothetical protein
MNPTTSNGFLFMIDGLKDVRVTQKSNKRSIAGTITSLNKGKAK